MTLCLRTVKPVGARKNEMLLHFQRRFSRAQGHVLPLFWISLVIASALPLRMASGLMMANVRSISLARWRSDTATDWMLLLTGSCLVVNPTAADKLVGTPTQRCQASLLPRRCLHWVALSARRRHCSYCLFRLLVPIDCSD
jgi:hypothetical protein